MAISSAVRQALEANGVRPFREQRLGAGYGSTAYRIRGGASDPPGDLVLRVPKAPLDRSIATLERECAVIEALRDVDFDVAIPRDMRALRGPDGAFLGTTHRFVAGAALRQVPLGEAREQLCADLGRFLSVLHAVPVASVEAACGPRIDLWADRYRGLIEETLPHLPRASRRWLSMLGEEFSRIGTSQARRVLTHGDVQGPNLLLDEDGRLMGVIDFGDAAIADPALDFAGILNTLRWRDLEQVWAHYTGVIDADVERRVRFYIAVEPIYQVLYGEAAEGPAERAAGLRKIAARAAAANRAAAKADA